MTRDDIAHLMNDTAPLLSGWGTEAHFQNFAQALMKMVAAAEREACAKVVDASAAACLNNPALADVLDGSAAAIRNRGTA